MSKTPYNKLYPETFTAEDYVNPDTYIHTRAPVENALSLIPEAYTCETFHRIEQKRIFHNSWVGVGCVDQLRKPGAVIVADVGGQSIIITRNKAGELRGFYNVCRHRGVKMLADDCTAVKSSRIRCPYHSWAYDLDGNCIGTPLFEGSEIPEDMQSAFSMGGVEKFDRADYPLFSVHVESWGVLVFVNLSENPKPLREQLGDLPGRVEEYRFEEWVVVKQAQFLFDANYKLVGENFMEYYHLPWVHPELIQVSRMEDHYRWQGRGMYTGMVTWPISQGNDGGWLGLPPMESLQGKSRETGRFLWLFPNTAISIMPNHIFIMITRPDGPNKTIEDTYILVHPESLDAEGSAGEVEQLSEFWTLVNNQDIDAVAQLQAGLKMKPYRGGRLCYRFEEPVHRYQNMVIDKMVGLERIPEGDPEEMVQMFQD